VTRKLRIFVEWGFTGVSDCEDDYDLPEGWDEMTEGEQQAIIADHVQTTIFNQVGGSGEVVEVDE